MFINFILTLQIILLAPFALSKTFSNSYISFELPPSWNCVLEQTEWICRSIDTKESKEAIIILTAKEVGPLDKFEIYLKHLSNPIVAKSKSGEQFQSEVKIKPNYSQVQGHNWMDSLHMNSEIQDYFTRYLVTTKEKISVLVTFSSHKNFYAKYSQLFNRIIQSINIKSTKNIMKDISASSGYSGSLGHGKDQGILMPNLGPDIPTTPASSSRLWILLAVVSGLILFYVFSKKKSSRKRK